MLRLILLLCVRHLMLLGPRKAGGWMSWPNNDCSFDSRSSSTEHRVQHSVMEEACQCQPFCITCVTSAPSWPRCAPCTRSCYVSVSVAPDDRSPQP